jgi:O-antigen/teichoic acid export membrane protein
MTNFNLRVFIKYVSNGLVGVFKLIVELLIPKLTGISDYGSFVYIRDTFFNITNSLDMSFSEAFYQISSKYPKNYSIVIFQSSLILLILLILFFFNIGLFLFPSLLDLIFPSQIFYHVSLGSLLAFSIYLVSNITFFSDSKKLTVYLEIIKIICVFIMSFVFYYFFSLENISIDTIYILFTAFNLLIFLSAIFYFESKFDLINKLSITKNKFFFYKKKYLQYSLPLFQANIFVFVFIIFDRWFLQVLYGNIEQAFIGFAIRIMLIITVLISSFYPIYRQQLADFFSNGNEINLKNSFKKIYLLFSIATFFSFFLIFNLNKILIFFGDDFNDGFYVILIMLLYPIHQVFGQSADAILLSLEKTKLFKSLRIYLTLFGFILTYIFVAPMDLLLPGLELGALGLALKMVLGQFVDVHFRLFYSCKFIGLNFVTLLKKEFSIIFFISGFYFLINFILNHLFGSNISNNIYMDIFISGIIYFIFTVLFIIIFPSIISCKRSDFKFLKNIFK